MISISHALDEATIKLAVSEKVPSCWRRASLILTGSDGESTYSFFTQKTEGVRIELVKEFFRKGCPWAPFLVQAISKGASWQKVAGDARGGIAPWRRDPHEKTRVISFDARVDHAAQLVLLRLLGPMFKRGTPKNVIGFVPGVNPFDALVGIIACIQGATEKFRFAKAFDLRSAFDMLDWELLDKAIDLHLGEVIGDGPRVDQRLREALKSLARVRMQQRDGSPVPRTRGIPQGAALSPFLLNVYLRTLDHRVIRRLHDLGCVYYRYADDMLIVGPTIDAIEKATSVLSEEVHRVRLTIKDGTGKLCDLRNPQNPVEWLGIEFNHKKTRVPRARIEAKAADLLVRVRSGQLEPRGLDVALGQLREHYSFLLGDDEAMRAVESIRRLLRPFLNDLPEKGAGIEHIIRQLPSWKTGGPAQSRATPVGHHHRVGDLPRGSSCEPTWGPSQGPYEERSTTSASDTPLTGRGSTAPTASSTGGSSPGTSRGSSLSSSSSSSPSKSGCPLAVDHAVQLSDRPLPVPPPEPKGRVRLGKNKSTPGDGDRPVVLVVVPTKGRQRGKVLLRFSDRPSIILHVGTKKKSSAEVVVTGYQLAMMALPDFEGVIRLHVRNAVVRGHVFSRYRVRSPRLLRQWDRLLPLLDERVELVDVGGRIANAVRVEGHPPRPS